ncbi:tyrosine-protein phosphatase [Novosphingobium sp. fls2-241-R2A-195]|jgi:protein-tyrosine phosphatase|uniref:tyrosine-protein phosphatase n=1 Tax=Novosphingobium sp. fls2-241-R2A-195 TaxID=3040296 RepID=UPI00254D991F|nr:tyrosine-protein phosphatase [Novosphingobium sp. fls2-241-R2A-195]
METTYGLINFRDFGGLEAADGMRVRSDRLFRSGHLGWLDDVDARFMIDMDFDVVVDLRYAEERRKELSPWPEDRLARLIAHDGAANRDAPHFQIMRAADASIADIRRAYVGFYAALPFDRWYRPLFAEAVRRIASGEGRVLVHCTAGKDRTGTLVALLLALLGVDDEAILADYLRTQGAPGMDALRDHVARTMLSRRAAADPGLVDALIGVAPDYLRAALFAVRQEAGSVEGYFAASGINGEILSRLRGTLLVRRDD